MSDKKTKWVEAGKLLSRDKNLLIECPECGNGILIVKDEKIEKKNFFDRYLICNNCGKWNVITSFDNLL